MGKLPVSMRSAFSVEEVSAASLVLAKNNEAYARELTDALMGGSLDVDDEFLTILAMMSDDLAVRVGGLRGLTPEQSVEWTGGLLKEHGHPTTWKVEWVDEEEDDEAVPPPDP